jgi:hypothetical protein
MGVTVNKPPRLPLTSDDDGCIRQIKVLEPVPDMIFAGLWFKIAWKHEENNLGTLVSDEFMWCFQRK